MKGLVNKLDIITNKHKEIEQSLSLQNSLDTETLVKLNKEYAELSPLIKKISDYKKCKKDIDDLNELK